MLYQLSYRGVLVYIFKELFNFFLPHAVLKYRSRHRASDRVGSVSEYTSTKGFLGAVDFTFPLLCSDNLLSRLSVWPVYNLPSSWLFKTYTLYAVISEPFTCSTLRAYSPSLRLLEPEAALKAGGGP